ncbi:MAG: hypothetical protein A3I44_02440 [Candidatus Sungbacteria bacterium RIFCSPLOWO2_02_FULL_51_17]|uniref:Uncharacterized protein n=1 Tax=Candidatus Sungbacteria bacterium RIFCSPHIGHO2_02_FULL_51_29 TaxID=1802273 RepID=A0A1G2KT37_9BACT|nr:MAG: hypothetical protein A3C16_05470 [Candidatus Sungbacteria bacterium RIFCSPHIGHO2_02_FULL_51_29]OHA11930.1 MAG: hypothetical protein A3I44_02440 [Candidatus Sungbacteria bacterium RIFCSPLOWO2_02_FULL_51_17]
MGALAVVAFLGGCHPEIQQRPLDVKLLDGNIIACPEGFQIDNVTLVCYVGPKSVDDHNKMTIPISSVSEIRFKTLDK